MATIGKHAFELEGADGAPLRGDVRAAGDGAGRPAVVICHGFKGFKDWGFFPTIAQRIANAGMTSVSFNFSGSGVGAEGDRFSEPDRFRAATPSNDLTDLGTVWEATRRGALLPGGATPSTLGLFGHSRGGGTAIVFAAARPECRALVTWNAIASFQRWDAETIARWRASGTLEIVNSRTGEVLPLDTAYLDDVEVNGDLDLSIESAAAAIRAPWLLVHGDEDETVSPAEGRLLADRQQTTGRHVGIEGGTHTFGARHPWAGPTPEFDRAMDETVGWLVDALL